MKKSLILVLLWSTPLCGADYTREVFYDKIVEVQGFKVVESPTSRRFRDIAIRAYKYTQDNAKALSYAQTIETTPMPRLTASVAEEEGQYKTTALGWGGSEGVYQIMPKAHGEVPTTFEAQTTQFVEVFEAYRRKHKGKLFAALVEYNAGPTPTPEGRKKAEAYARRVLQRVREIPA